MENSNEITNPLWKTNVAVHEWFTKEKASPETIKFFQTVKIVPYNKGTFSCDLIKNVLEDLYGKDRSV